MRLGYFKWSAILFATFLVLLVLSALSIWQAMADVLWYLAWPCFGASMACALIASQRRP